MVSFFPIDKNHRDPLMIFKHVLRSMTAVGTKVKPVNIFINCEETLIPDYT